MKKVLITGSKGFIGSNLLVNLKYTDGLDIIQFDIQQDITFLKKALGDADIVFHLAGVNRPENADEFTKSNTELTENIVDALLSQGRKIPLVFSSSIQAELDNPYGRSKLESEKQVQKYNRKGGEGYIFRLTNVFGKWCRPDYNSVVATFCYNIANGKDIIVSDKNKELELIYIDDLVAEFRKIISGKLAKNKEMIFLVSPTYHTRLGELADYIISFRTTSSSGSIPEIGDDLIKKLHSTYLSYLPLNKANYLLETTFDARGMLFEFIKSQTLGLIFVSRTKPGVTRGNHFHHSKNERFCVIEGEAVIRLRHLLTDEIVEYYVNGKKPEVVNIIPGYTHSMTNMGSGELITIFWANEPFDLEKPDTYHEKVIK
jgi:UDP-2-acetamido-2,6-beta-L-arabino-hexul-4-ose reductase